MAQPQQVRVPLGTVSPRPSQPQGSHPWVLRPNRPWNDRFAARPRIQECRVNDRFRRNHVIARATASGYGYSSLCSNFLCGFQI